MKKFLLLILSVCLITCCIFSLTACDFFNKEESETGMEHEHSYVTTVVAPTCTEQGYTIYTCECGDEYIDNYVNEIGHN